MIHYQEVKYISHISRTMFIYFILFVVYFILYDFRLDTYSFFRGLIIFTISYSLVYFLNDYADKEEDLNNGKSNLYLSINSFGMFWLIVFVLLILGIVLTLSVSITAFGLLLLIYFLNYLYSFNPFRFRDVFFIREINIFAIYFIKWLLISEYLGYVIFENNNPEVLPLSIFVMGSLFAAIGESIHKRHTRPHKISEYLFGSLFFISLIFSFFQYPQMILFFLPMPIIMLFISIKYKNNYIPIGKYQVIYFLYVLLIYATAS